MVAVRVSDILATWLMLCARTCDRGVYIWSYSHLVRAFCQSWRKKPRWHSITLRHKSIQFCVIISICQLASQVPVNTAVSRMNSYPSYHPPLSTLFLTGL